MYSSRSFKDAYLKVYENLNEATSTLASDVLKKGKTSETPKPTPTPETPKASLAPETPKAEPSLFKSKSELDDLRSSAARATMAGPSKEAQALMSPRAKRILSGNSVYSRGSGRDDMIAGNIQRARGGSSTPSSTSTSSETPSDATPDMSRFKKIGPAPTSGFSSTQTPPSSSTSSRPSTSKIRIGNINIDDTDTTKITKTTKTTLDKGPKGPKNERGNRGNRPERDDKNPRSPRNNRNDRNNRGYFYQGYTDDTNTVQRSLNSSYEYENSNLVESHYEVGDKVSCKASGMTGKVVKVDSEEKGKYYTVKREDGKTVKYAPDELKKGNGGAPKDKEEKFHTKLDKLVHNTFGSSPEEKKQQKEETDLFDYVLEYLVSEGYADTNENALVIMANMSEEWRESILEEGYKKFPKGKVDKKMASKVVKAAKHQVAATWGDKNKSSENQEKANKLGSQAKKMAEISTEKNKEANSWRRGVQSKHKSEVKRKIRYMDDIAKQKKKEYEERETEMKKKMRRELGGG